MIRALAAVVALAVLATAGVSHAQLARPTSGVELAPVSLAAPDDALAVDANPAGMALLPAWSFVYAGAAAPSASGTASGHSVYFATPIAFGLSAGVGVGTRLQGDGRLDGSGAAGVFSFALALRLGRSWSLGGVLRTFAAPLQQLEGVTTIDVSLSWRPAPMLAFAFSVHDLNGPVLRGPATLHETARSFVLAVAWRPVRAWPLTLDVAGALDTDGHVATRAALSIPFTYFGSIVGAVEIDHADEPATREVRGTAGLVLQWDHVAAGGGVIASDTRSPPGAFMMARVEGAARDGLPEPHYVLDLEIKGSSERGFIADLLALDRAVRDERVVGVLLRPRGGLGMARAEELRMLVDALRAHGKPVVCHLENASGSDLYACAGATRTYVDPAGGIRLMGPSSDSILLGDALRMLGVRADFVRIGQFKSAVEQLVNAHGSDAAHEERRVLLDDFAERLRGDLARSFHVSETAAQQRIDAGPYTAGEAVAAHLAVETLDEQDLDLALPETMGGNYARRTERPSEAPDEWTTAPRVGVIVIDGDIVDGDNIDIPFLDIHMTGGHTAVAAIDAMAEDPTIGAIVLRVDSPGGSALASDQIWRALRRAAERKPIVASMGAVAASGGYYVASAAREIWADPATVTGSIGIFYGKVDLAPLASRIGVTIESDQRGRHAGAESMYRRFTPDERALLADKVRIWYRQFLSRVHEGRHTPLTRIDALGRGRVWSGDRARQNGLVDHLGGLASAIAEARRLGGLRDDCDVVVRPERPSSLLDYVVQNAGQGTAASEGDAEIRAALGEQAPQGGELGEVLDALPPATRRAIGTALAMRHVGEGSAFAWMPYVMETR